MTIIQAIILGIIQGLSEFLPISSSAHLVLIPKLLGWQTILNKTSVQVSFYIDLHFGSLIALALYFWLDIKKLIFSLSSKNKESTERRILFFLIIATIPAVVFGFLFKDFFEGLFEKPLAVAFFLIITGIILFLTESSSRPYKKLKGLSLADSLIIGFAQVLAIIPGISRSGATISAGIWSGLKRESSARFSFLLSIPVILGATLASLSELKIGEIRIIFFAGFLSSLIVSYLAIKYFISYLRKGNLRIFAFYCWIIGGISIILLLF